MKKLLLYLQLFFLFSNLYAQDFKDVCGTQSVPAAGDTIKEIVILAVDPDLSDVVPSWFDYFFSNELPVFYRESTHNNKYYRVITIKKTATTVFKLLNVPVPHDHDTINMNPIFRQVDVDSNLTRLDGFDGMLDNKVYVHFTSISSNSSEYKNWGRAKSYYEFTTNDDGIDANGDGQPEKVKIIVTRQTRGINKLNYYGVMVHETGHDLFNFVDGDHSGTYEFEHYGLGSFCVMSHVLGFDESAQQPASYNPVYSHIKNWVTPVQITSNSLNYPLQDFQSNHKLYMYSPSPPSLPGNAVTNEKFYITYIKRDQSYIFSHHPADGVLIWHTKGTGLSNNSGTFFNWYSLDIDLESAHGKTIWTETSDNVINTGVEDPISGRDKLEIRKVNVAHDALLGGPYHQQVSIGDATMFYLPGSNKDFTFYTNPNSNWYNATETNRPHNVTSGFAFKNFRMDGAVPTADIYVNYYAVDKSLTLPKGTWYFNSDLTINSGVTLTIPEGTVLKFVPGKKLIVNGTLNAIGNSTSRIIFTSDGSGNWGGVQFNSGSSGTIDNCDISTATIGIKTYNTSPQIYRTNIENCETGVYCDYYSSPNLYYNNIRYCSSYGVYCNVYSSPNFLGGGSYSGYNVIKNNNDGNYGIYTIYNCNPVLGNTWYGQNSIYGHNGPEVYAAYYSNVAAKNNWWGSAPPSSSEFSASSSTIDYALYLTTEPSQNQQRSILPSNNNDKYAPALSIMSSQGDNLNMAEEKQKEGKYDEAINLFLDVFKKEKENSKGRYALIKIEECFTQAGKKDFLDFSKKELKQLIKEETELYVVLLELETHQLYNLGYKDDAMNNLKTILKKYNYNTEIEKQTLYRIGAFYLDLYNDTLSARKTFDELAEKYPDDELLTYANMLLNEERYNKPNAKKVEQLTETIETDEELLSNNPNPFNPSTIINYRVPENSLVTIKVYDVLGKEVAELVNEEKVSGNYSVTFNATNLSSGVYFYTINTGKYSAVRKMLLIK